MSTSILNHIPAILKRYRLIVSGILLLLVAVVSLSIGAKTFAFTPNYNSSNLIDNPTFLDNTSMTVSSIQSFLNNVGSGLATRSDVESCSSTTALYYTHCGATISDAQIIYDAAQAYGINPEDILATLEKEQSLITDPSPTSSQLNCAMGYESCNSNYSGFFTQVDNGAFTLRYNYEGALGDATWASWSPAANYPCKNAGYINGQMIYSTGLYPGNTVTFGDPGGTAETITIANAATASLYCYTPYVGPYSQTGYSGSYNFVYYFQLWFGSTQAQNPYAWALEGQSAYSDSGRTDPFTGTISVAPGQKLYLSLEARNIGYDSWSQTGPPALHLGTDYPEGRVSPFYDTSWISASRPAGLSVSSVPPGGEATIDFTLTAPSQPGSYTENYNLVADGATWLNDPGLAYQINVVVPQAINTQNTVLSSGQTLRVGQYLLSPDAQSTLNLQGDGNLVLYSQSSPTWANYISNSKASYLIMQGDGNLVEYDSSGNPLWWSNTQNNPGACLVLQTDGNLVIYNPPCPTTPSITAGSAIWESNTPSNPAYLYKVQDSLNVGKIFEGQSLQPANKKYRLTLQTDGNLVLYNSSNQALWWTNTQGSTGDYLDMQGDGNLVLYNGSNQPLWWSNTQGSGGSDYVAMQGDGNLVVYNSNSSPLWWTNTQGK